MICVWANPATVPIIKDNSEVINNKFFKTYIVFSASIPLIAITLDAISKLLLLEIELKIELLFRDWRQAKNEKDLQRMNIDQARRLRAADINTLTPSQRAIIELDDANHFANKLERAETKMAYYQLRIDIANYLLIPANQLNFTNHIFQTQNFNYIQLILSNLKLLILD